MTDQLSIVEQPAEASRPPAPPMPETGPAWRYSAAVVALLVIAVGNVVALGDSNFTGRTDVILANTIFWNILVSIGLLRRNESWRLFGFFRAWVSIAYGIAALALATLDAFDALLTVAHSAGLLLLLCGARAGITRSLAGVVLAIGFPLALQTYAVAAGIEAKVARAKSIAADAMDTRSYSDSELGFAIAATEGWTLLRLDSSLVNASDCNLKLVHSADLAATLTVYAADRHDSPDSFLDEVVAADKSNVDRGRLSTEVAGRPARSMRMHAGDEADRSVHLIVVVQNGGYLYCLEGWTRASNEGVLYQEVFRLLEGFKLTSADNGLG